MFFDFVCQCSLLNKQRGQGKAWDEKLLDIFYHGGPEGSLNIFAEGKAVGQKKATGS